MANVFDVANYFLNYADKDEASGELISNLKLQKLVYYAQGFYLALFEEPLFSEEIEAWPHGPVAPALYHRYKEHGGAPIPAPTDFDAKEVFTEDQIELLDEVYNLYGQFSAWKLRNMTHEEAPWVNNEEHNEVISHKELKEYFATQLS